MAGFYHLRKILQYVGVRFRCSAADLNKERKFNSLDKVVKHRFLYGHDVEDFKSKIASQISVTVIGNGAIGQPRCLCIFTDCRSYMFNCGEGSMRHTREYQKNMSLIRNIFITEKIWENLSGLPDFYITQQVKGVKKITLHGPVGINDFKKVAYTMNSDVSILTKTAEDSFYEDDTLKIEYVPFFRRSKQFQSNFKNDSSQESVFSYICTLKKSEGNLLFEKCIELNITSGQDLIDLKRGLDVTLPCGKVVKATDVCSPSTSNIVIFVVDCPYDGMLDDFVSEEKFSQYLYPPEKSESVFAVFHFTPSHVFRSHKYRQWMARFHSDTKHVVLNSLNSTLSSEAVHNLQHIFHTLHPRMFPLLHEEPCKDLSKIFPPETEIIQADSMMQFDIRPIIQMNNSCITELNPKVYAMDAKEAFGEDLSDLKKLIEMQENNLTSVEGNYPEIVFLGTGSSSSTTYRNVTVILINVSEDCSILFDCGEGAFTQFLRYYGYEKLPSVLKKISCIFLSHHHLDHYMGVFKLIKVRYEAFLTSFEPYKPVALMISKPLQNHISRFHKYFGHLGSNQAWFFRSENFTEDRVHNELKEFIGDVKLCTVPVIHTHHSYGIVISTDDWKIAYSGDAAPSQSLINAGKDCTVLIHEASVEDNFMNEAASKYHSTPAQVVELAEQMNAKCTILTHFSKRYLAVPVFPQMENQNVGVAFDNMSVRLHELPLLPLFIPYLKKMFSDNIDEFYSNSINEASIENVFWKLHSKV